MFFCPMVWKGAGMWGVSIQRRASTEILSNDTPVRPHTPRGHCVQQMPILLVPTLPAQCALLFRTVKNFLPR